MPFNTNTQPGFSGMKSGNGQSLMAPKQSVAVALAMQKKNALDAGNYQAPNLMSALKKKKKAGGYGPTTG